MRALWSEDRVNFRGRVLLDARRVGVRPSRGRRCRSTSPRAGRSWRATRAGSVTGSSARPARAWTSTPRSCCPAVREGAEAAGRDVDAVDRMIEIKVSYDTGPAGGAGEHAVLGAAGAEQGAEARHHRPGRDGACGGCAAHRADRVAVDRRVRPGRGGRGRAAVRRGRPGPPGASTRRVRTSGASSSCASATWPHACARSKTLDRIFCQGLASGHGRPSSARRAPPPWRWRSTRPGPSILDALAEPGSATTVAAADRARPGRRSTTT